MMEFFLSGSLLLIDFVICDVMSDRPMANKLLSLSIAGTGALKMWHGGRAPRRRVRGRGLSLFQLWGLRVLPWENFRKQVQIYSAYGAFCG